MEISRITSAQNPRLKSAIRLQTSRGRSKQNRIVIFGVREIERAVGNVELIEVYLDLAAINDPQVQEFVSAASSGQESPDLFELPSELFKKLAYGDRHDGIVAVANCPPQSLSRISISEDSLIVVVQGIEKPGNLGAIFRSADGAGVQAVVIADPLTTAFHPNSIRASLGTVFSMSSAAESTETIQQWLRENHFNIYCAHPDTATDFSKANFHGRTAIVFGNEANGLSDEWLIAEFEKVSLPMMGIADSLNVSVSAAVLMYEARRQRTKPE